jgi:succinyl-diaminopimelate desuccinylase
MKITAGLICILTLSLSLPIIAREQGGKMVWKKSDLKNIFARIDSLQDEMIKTQQALTALPALGPQNGGDGEKARADYLAGLLKKLGFTEVNEYRAPDKTVPSGYRPNIVAKIPGEKHDKTIWIMTHMDIVPAGPKDLWQTDPFQAVVKEGKIFGRGVEDNQQELVASIYALKAVLDSKFVPAYDAGVVLVADEETGSAYGIGYMLKEHNIFKKGDIIVVPDAGNEQGTMVEVAEKSIAWLKFTIRGKQTHGSTPNKGVNAHRIGARFLLHLDEVLHNRFNATDSLFDPPLSTFEPTKKEANVPNINTVPGEDIFYFDCRIMPNYKINDVLTAVKAEAAKYEEEYHVHIQVDTSQFEQAAPPTPVTAPVVGLLTRAIKFVYGVEPQPKGIGGGTVAALFRRAGYDAAVWSKLNGTAHQPNEYCVIDNMVNNAKVYAYLLGE